MRVYLLLLFICINNYSSYAQTNEIKMEKLKNDLMHYENELIKTQKIIQAIQDSIKFIEYQANNEKTKLILSKGIVCITKNPIQAKLRDIPNLKGREILVIPKKSEIKVIEYGGDSYWKVEFENSIGYVNEVNLLQTEEMKSVLKNYNDNKEKRDKEEKIISAKYSEERQKREKEELIERFGKENLDRIHRHLIWLGMTDEMARASIGEPKSINRTVGTWGVHEQWVYDKRYLYFENGKLTSWQD